MSATAILGIDPGLSGALALFDPADGSLEISDIPTLKIGKTVIDEYALARIIDSWSPRIREVWLEQVGVRPGEGAVGAFSFGRGYGLLRGICVASFLTIHDITPAKWKSTLRVPADKDGARLRASNLMPREAHRWPLKKHDGRAEAALIALYASHLHQGSSMAA